LELRPEQQEQLPWRQQGLPLPGRLRLEPERRQVQQLLVQRNTILLHPCGRRKRLSW